MNEIDDDNPDATASRFEDRLVERIHAGVLNLGNTSDAHDVVDRPRLRLPNVGSSFLGRWNITRRLGRGAFGVVFEARHREISELLRAVKFLLPEHARDPSIRKRFHDEAAIMATIKGSHLVDVTDYGEHEGIPYFVMERLDGEPLEDLLARSAPLPLGCFFELALPLLDALTELHTYHIVHRDLKPSNVFVAKGSSRLKLLDFGLAKTMLSVSRGEGMVGTPLYMSPEQFAGDGDIRSDVYSVSVVLYQMLTGTLPIPFKDNLVAFARRVLSDAPTPIRSHRQDIPASVEAAIEQGLAKLPEQRLQTAQDLRQRIALGLPASSWEGPGEARPPMRFSVRLVLGKPRRASSFMARAFRPKVRIKEARRFSVDQPIAGIVSTTIELHVVVVHVCHVTQKVVRVHPDDDSLEVHRTIPRIPPHQGQLLIDGYSTKPRGKKEFRVYSSTDHSMLTPLLKLPCDEPVCIHDAYTLTVCIEGYTENSLVQTLIREYEVV